MLSIRGVSKSFGALQALKDVKTAKDFALVIYISGQFPTMHAYFRQVQGRFGVRFALIPNGVNYPSFVVYYPGQLVGILNGMKGAAEYEKLTGFIGGASGAMDTFSVAQTLLIGLVLLSNVAFFASKAKRG